MHDQAAMEEDHQDAGCFCLPLQMKLPTIKMETVTLPSIDMQKLDPRSIRLPKLRMPFRDNNVQEIDEKVKSIGSDSEEDEVDLFGEDYEAMLRGNTPKIPGDDEFDEIPGQDVLEELYNVQVVSKTREKIAFRDLVQSKDHRRHVVIFIRHFFCGNCYGFVRALSAEMPLHKVNKLKPTTKVSIIGCGDPILIPQYLQQTGCPYEIYADPSRSLYNRLGMAANTSPPPEMPQYVKKYSLSFMANLARSLVLTSKTGKLSGGPILQVGGELIWIDGELQHMHKMRNAGDHMEVSELIKLMRRQERELNKREGSVHTANLTKEKEDGKESTRNSFQNALRRISSRFSLGDVPPLD